MRLSDLVRVAAGTGLTLCASAALAASPPANSFVGTYNMTTSSGSGVRSTEIRLLKNGEATMKTESSALSMRPEARAAMPPIIERGTWHRQGSRAIVHITSTSNVTVSDPSQKPAFTDIAFSLQGCILHLEATDSSAGGLDFTKHACH